MFQAVKNIYHNFQAVIANIWYGHPGEKLKVIGITGTDGKTTTSLLIYYVLKNTGHKVSLISSVYARIGGKTFDTGFHVTTPSVFWVQKYLKMAADCGDEYFVLETTSHALDQFRVSGIQFEIGVVTNITHEHLQYHKNYLNYVKAKVRLLNNSTYAIVNADDMSYPFIRKLYQGDLITYSLNNSADFQIDLSSKLNQPLPRFNQYNYLAAYVVCQKLGLNDQLIIAAMRGFQLPPGRLEKVYDQDFMIIIDFAHTPNAIYEVLKSLAKTYPKRTIIHVFGAASQRDDSKRPLMGEASGEFADRVILTEEDYRKEDPQKIAREIAAGLEKKGFQLAKSGHFTQGKEYVIEIDRQRAVNRAIDSVGAGDIVILTGKGHEKSLCRGTKEYPWDEKQAVLKSLASLKK